MGTTIDLAYIRTLDLSDNKLPEAACNDIFFVTKGGMVDGLLIEPGALLSAKEDVCACGGIDKFELGLLNICNETPLNNITEYTVEHSLNKYPSIKCLDNNGRLCLLDIVYNSLNSFTIMSDKLFTGTLIYN